MSDPSNTDLDAVTFIRQEDLAILPKVGYERKPMEVKGLYVPPTEAEPVPEQAATQPVICMAADRPFATHRHCTAHRTTKALCVDCWRRQ